jgi:hypothetical protein
MDMEEIVSQNMALIFLGKTSFILVLGIEHLLVFQFYVIRVFTALILIFLLFLDMALDLISILNSIDRLGICMSILIRIDIFKRIICQFNTEN